MQKFADFKEPARSEMVEIRERLQRDQEEAISEGYLSEDYAFDGEDLDFQALGIWVIEKGTPEQKQRFIDYLKMVLEKAPETESSSG